VIEEVGGAAGQAVDHARRILEPQVAAVLARMMETTVTEGTARKVFAREQRSSRSPLRDVAVAGKTGSLSEAEPYRDYSWFVGFAPVDEPRIAVAAVVVNERIWHVKAPVVAREALKSYFAGDPVGGVRTASR
jgi:cell division protein FtsI/penicillin-binding protein 2